MALAEPGKPFELKVVYEDGGHGVGIFRNLLLVVAHREPSPDVLNKLLAIHRRGLQQEPEGLALIVAIHAKAPPPSEEARRAISDYFKSSKKLLGVVLVIEGEGFGAAAKRGALSLLGLSQRFAFPYSICGDVSDAMTTLERKTKRAFAPSEDVGACIDYLRAL